MASEVAVLPHVCQRLHHFMVISRILVIALTSDHCSTHIYVHRKLHSGHSVHTSLVVEFTRIVDFSCGLHTHLAIHVGGTGV